MAICPTCRKSFPEGTEMCPEHREALLPSEAFSSADVDLPAGHQVGEYLIETKIGEGGFGAVYRAVHPLIGKTVAVKVLARQYSSNPQIVSRFIAEARAVNQIRHRNIIDIFAFGALPDGRQFYVMELLEGMTLDRLIKDRGRVEPELAITLLRGVARALDAAHAQGIAHRDLKPENIFLVTDEDGGFAPKLLDFGIAKLLAEAPKGIKTRTGTPIGTPYYMSPEQCRGKDVDHRTDVYSFGIVVHEMLTGQLPFTGDSIVDLLVKQTSVAAPTVSSVRPELSPLLDAAVLHMLEKDPASRPTSLTSAIDELTVAAQAAGHSVKSPPRKSGDGVPSVAVRIGEARRSTPGNDAAFAEARTIAEGEIGTKTLRGAETPVTETPRRSMKLGVGLAAALVIGVVAILMMRSPDHPTEPRPATAASPDIAPQPAPTPAVSIATQPTSTGSVVVTPAPANVDITVQSTPPRAEVWDGANKLGVAPGPIALPRGDAKVKLVVKAAGYAPGTIEVVPNANAVVAITLQKAGSSHVPGKQPTSGELENPFGN